MEDILPFLSLDPREVQARVLKMEAKENTAHAIIHIRNRTVQSPTGANWRKRITIDWDQSLKDIAKFLPDLDIAVHLHDGPKTYLDWTARQGYIKAARAGRCKLSPCLVQCRHLSSSVLVVDESALPIEVKTNECASCQPSLESHLTHMECPLYSLYDRERHCPPNSNLHRTYQGLDLLQQPLIGPGFVSNHLGAMSYCNDPSLVVLNGASLAARLWIPLLMQRFYLGYPATRTGGQFGPLMPSFTMAKMHDINGDILWPASIQYDLNPANESSFLAKTQHKILWRGSPDGIHFSPQNDWRRSHRFRLITLANCNDTTDIRIVRMTRTDLLGWEYQVDEHVPLAYLNERYSNIQATSRISQCAPDYCSKVNADLKRIVPKATLDEMADHRYVMDVDGNSYALLVTCNSM